MAIKSWQKKLAKGLTTGAGVFVSSYVGEAVETQTDLGAMGIGLSQMAVGAGAAVASEQLTDTVLGDVGVADDLIELGGEHIGYGIHGAGFAQIADELQAELSDQQTGAAVDRVVTVEADAEMNSEAENPNSQTAESFSLDTA